MKTFSRDILLVAMALAMPVAGTVYAEDTETSAVTATAMSPAQTAALEKAKAKLAEYAAHCDQCLAALQGVKDAETAAGAAKVLHKEALAQSRLHKDLERLAKQHFLVSCPAPESGDEDAPAMGADEKMTSPEFVDATQDIVVTIEEKEGELMQQLQKLGQLTPPMYGCEELKDAGYFYFDVAMLTLTPEQHKLIPKVMDSCRKLDAIRTEALNLIVGIADAETAKAASKQLAALIDREDSATARLRSLLEQVPEEEVDHFCMIAFGRYDEERAETPGNAPEPDALRDKLLELLSMDPPYYGVPHLGERISGFIRMPR